VSLQQGDQPGVLAAQLIQLIGSGVSHGVWTSALVSLVISSIAVLDGLREEQTLCNLQIFKCVAQNHKFSSQIIQVNMSEFADPQRRQSPILVDGPPVLNRISVCGRQEQLDKNISVSNYSQWLTFPAAAKPGGSGGWLSLSIAAIISALVSGGPLN
jgi:hypothetical protein